MKEDNCVMCDDGYTLEGGKCTKAAMGLAEMMVKNIIGFLRWSLCAYNFF